MSGISTGPVALDPEVSRLAPALPIAAQVLVRAAERFLGAPSP
jgi:hypothetical protein